MSVFLSIFGGIIFSLIVFSFVFARMVRTKKILLLDWILLSIGLFNGLGFAFIVWSTDNGKNPSWGVHILTGFDSYTTIVYLLLNFVMVMAIIFGWDFARLIKPFMKEVRRDEPVRFHEFQTYNIVAWISLLISVISYILYTYAYGGLNEYLSYSKYIRSGITMVSNPLSFLKPLGGLSIFSCLIFFGMIFIKRKKTNLLIIIGFTSSLLYALYVLYSWEGRFALVVFVLSLVLALILLNYKNVFQLLKRLVIYFAISILIIFIVDIVLERNWISLGFVEFFSKELSFPFISFITHFSYGQMRWFIDVFYSPLFFLPERIWSKTFDIESISSFNTYLATGYRKGQGVTGELPIDLLTFGYSQAQVMGVLIIGLLIGFILFYIEKVLRKIPILQVHYSLYAYIALNIAVRTVLYADPEHIITRNYHLIVGFILIWIVSRLRRRNRM